MSVDGNLGNGNARLELDGELSRSALEGAPPNELVAVAQTLLIRNRQLEYALESRVVIEQAKGILAERYRLDMDAAFDVLRKAARSNRVRIHTLAADVVASAATPLEITPFLRDAC